VAPLLHAQRHFGSDGLQNRDSFTQFYEASPRLYMGDPWGRLACNQGLPLQLTSARLSRVF
jgi:hypothetical protein